MINGIVKWFSDEKGFGFVKAGGTDYFLHFKEIQADGFKSVKQDDKVSFEPEMSPKGPVAKSVMIQN